MMVQVSEDPVLASQGLVLSLEIQVFGLMEELRWALDHGEVEEEQEEDMVHIQAPCVEVLDQWVQCVEGLVRWDLWVQLERVQGPWVDLE